MACFSGNHSFFLRGIIMKYGKQIFVSALVLSGALFFSQSIYAQENVFFREINGTVEVKPPGSSVWASAVAGDRIEKNTLISTGFKSTAIVIVGNSVITVRPVTRLTLEEIIRNQDGEQVSLHLQTGRIRADVKPPAEGKIDFTVRSPTVTASVRGTSFEFDTENLRVDNGRVQYALANGRQVYVAGGGTSSVDETNNTVINPFAAAAELLSPALPLGSDSGGPTGDHAPAVMPLPPPGADTPPPDIDPSPSGAGVGVGFGWD
jgi:hypothetical protein